MDCEQARQLIDDRVQVADDESGARDWSELDAHLAKCSKCSAELLQLMSARNLLAGLAGDEPTDEETDNMWQAIQQAGPAGALAMNLPTIRKRAIRFVAACAGIAAVLMIALQMGRQHDREARKMAACVQSMRGVSTAAATYAADSAQSFICPSADAVPGRMPAGEYSLSTVSSAETLSREHLEDLRVLGYSQGGEDPSTARPPASGVQTVEQEEMDKLAALGYLGPGWDEATAPAHLFDGQRDIAFGSQDVDGVFQGRDDDPDRFFADVRLSSSGSEQALPTNGACFPEDGQIDVFNVEELAGGLTFAMTNAKPTNPPSPPSLLELDTEPDIDFDGVAADDLAGAVMSSEQFNYVVTVGDGEVDAGTDTLVFGQVAAREQDGARGGSDPAQEPKGVGIPILAPDKVKNRAAPPSKPAALKPKIIKTGELSLEVPAYDEAAARVETIVGESGGFVADVSVKEKAGGALSGTIVIRVSPEWFEALFAALKEVGRVLSENVKSADVTAKYVDLEARIRGLQITEQRLAELIESKSFIDKIESLLEVEREMTRVRSQIEQFQGELRVMASRVALSTIAVRLSEPARTVPSAAMSVEVPVVADAAEALGEALTNLDGHLKSGKTSKGTDGTIRGDYKLNVSLARFGELLQAVEALGRVEERQITDRQFNDPTKPWADKVDCYVALVLYEPSRQPPRGTIKLEVGDVADARRQLDELLASAGAAVMSSKTTRRNDGSSVGELRLRIPAGGFSELVESLGSLGRTVAKETAGQAGRIVGGAASLSCDINLTLSEPVRQVPSGSMIIEPEAFETTRELLSALISEKGLQVLASASSQRPDGTWLGMFRLGIKAADMDAVVSRLESLGRVASRQIKGIGLGDLSQVDPEALGVINLTLAEKPAIAPEPNLAGDSIRGRLRDGLAGFYRSVGLIAFGLMAMAPWLIIVAGLALVALWAFRRFRKVPASVTSDVKSEG